MKLQLVAKYEKKLKGDPLDTLKKFEKNFKVEIFEQCHSAENSKRGDLCDFLTSIVLQNVETNEGGPFGAIQKVSKSLSVPKKSGTMGGSLVCFQSSGRLFCFFFSFWTRF